MMDDLNEQAPSDDLDDDQMEQEGSGDRNPPAPEELAKRNPPSSIQGSGDR